MECCSWCVWNAAVRLEFFLVRQVFFSEGEDVKEVVWYVGFPMCVLVFVVPLFFFLGWVTYGRWFVGGCYLLKLFSVMAVVSKKVSYEFDFLL